MVVVVGGMAVGGDLIGDIHWSTGIHFERNPNLFRTGFGFSPNLITRVSFLFCFLKSAREYDLAKIFSTFHYCRFSIFIVHLLFLI